uniref:Uncharacterized protein n=1 Tax=Arion vulgaris TaxID=1028688 RepID=A0A0B6ZYV2_9EUPU
MHVAHDFWASDDKHMLDSVFCDNTPRQRMATVKINSILQSSSCVFISSTPQF